MTVAVGGADASEIIQPQPAAGVLSPTDLRCEYRDDPLGIDVPSPRLSWIVRHPGGPRSRRPIRSWSRAIWQRLATTRATSGTADASPATRPPQSCMRASHCTRTRRAFGRSASGTRRGVPRPGANRPTGRWACSIRPNGKEPPGLARTSHGRSSGRGSFRRGEMDLARRRQGSEQAARPPPFRNRSRLPAVSKGRKGRAARDRRRLLHFTINGNDVVSGQPGSGRLGPARSPPT